MRKISVIIPTYDSIDSLDLCLRSCIEGCHTKDNVEIIVVVDGTYDINKDVIKKYENQIKTLILPENVGLCRATNLGVYNASNELILIVNDDNVFPFNWDHALICQYEPNSVIAPNHIEPFPSMFKQFIIKDLGRDPKTFDLNNYWKTEVDISSRNSDILETGSTPPVFMSKLDYLRIGGWDENYPISGVCADWDFFLKCQLSGLKMLRMYNCHFYHFVSLSTNNTEENRLKRQQNELDGHEYAKYKWGKFISHNPENNLKYL